MAEHQLFFKELLLKKEDTLFYGELKAAARKVLRAAAELFELKMRQSFLI